MQIRNKLKWVHVGFFVAGVSVLLAGCIGSSAVVSLPETQENIDTPMARGLAADFEWAELAQQRPVITLSEPEDHPADQNNVLGRWSAVIDWPHVAAGAASLPSGRIVTWASSEPDDFRSGSDYTHSAIYNPLNQSFTDIPIEGHDLFGAGIGMMSTGRTVAIGGGSGVIKTSVLDDAGWIGGDELPQVRAFGQVTALADGALIAMGGQTATAVQWRADGGWSEVAGDFAADFAALPQASVDQLDGGSAIVVAPDGRLFTAGSGLESFSLDLQGGYQSHGAQSADSDDRLHGTTVMYDVGKLLVAGGGRPSLSSAVTIDINGTVPVVASTGSLHTPRSMHNSVLLPGGQVMVVGGTEAGIPFSDENSVFEPELWDPSTTQWQKMAAHRMPRNYQSTALLMKDARVIAMGGGLCGDCTSNYQSAEIFEPPYLFSADGSAAARPDIISVPAQAAVGETMVVSASAGSGATIERFNLLRISAVTRHHNADQRLVPVTISSVATNDYELYLSQNENVLSPGLYWLYAIDSQGVPSVGHTIQILDAAAAPATTDGDNTDIRALPAGSLFQRGDVLALHYDVAADIDDIHAIASGKNITAFYGITPAVVVGTYGFDNNRRETYHVKFNNLTRKEAANRVATLAYGSGGYLDTKGYQADLEIAAQAQAVIWKEALDGGNDVWVAEGGPSDFTEEVMQQLLLQGVSLATLQEKIHVVQHSIAANEGNTDDQHLAFIKANTDYITLQNGNQPNATADLNTGVAVDDYFRSWASDSKHSAAWEFSMVYFEEKLDFSDTVEVLHILNIGTDMIADTNDFADFFD